MLGLIAGEIGAIAIVVLGVALALAGALVAGAAAFGPVVALGTAGGILMVLGLLAFVIVRRYRQRRQAQREALVLLQRETLVLLLSAGVHLLPPLARAATRMLGSRGGQASLLGLAVLAAHHLLKRDGSPPS